MNASITAGLRELEVENARLKQIFVEGYLKSEILNKALRESGQA